MSFRNLFLLALPFFFTGCDIRVHKVEGSGKVIREEREVTNFSSITLAGSGNLYVTPGDTPGLVIEAEDNILEYLGSEIHDGVLTLGRRWNDGKHHSIRIRRHEPINYHLTVTEVTTFTVAGSGSIATTLPLEGPSFALNIKGSGDMRLNLSAITIETDIAGSGDIILSGTTEHQDVLINGSGDYDAFGMTSKTAHVVINGSGDAQIHSTDDLDVSIAGSGTVTYTETPSITSKIFGSGHIIHK